MHLNTIYLLERETQSHSLYVTNTIESSHYLHTILTVSVFDNRDEVMHLRQIEYEEHINSI